jgi:hypothetical protein
MPGDRGTDRGIIERRHPEAAVDNGSADEYQTSNSICVEKVQSSVVEDL